MSERFVRTEMLLGQEAMERLAKARVAVFGVGGVGGYVVEALARSGVGALDLIDNDVVAESNINRQILALSSTLGRPKTEVAAERVKDINPDCKVTAYQMFFLPGTKDQFDFTRYDYVIDAIDTVTGKLCLIECAKAAGVPVISAMGAGNKRNPSGFKVSDLYDTQFDGLARIMRKECRKRGIESLKVVWSEEEPMTPEEGNTAFDLTSAEDAASSRRSTPGSVAFVPSVAGLVLAGEVVKDLAGFA
jgi:tRNA A37 threonylcarbamoyladenosine dehydratase